MSEALEARAEIIKLSRLLGRESTDLEYLGEVPVHDIRLLREQATDMLFSANGSTLSRLAAASRVLPVGLIATLGERSFGPVLSARLAGMLEPARAAEVASKMPAAFLADIAVELDPRRAHDVIARIPPRQIAEITRELVKRQEYVAMGRFVGHLEDEAIAAAVAEMDDRALLHVAFVLEARDRLDHLIGLLSPARLQGLIKAAAGEDLWPEVLDLLDNLSERHQRLVTTAAATLELEAATLQRFAAALVENELWRPGIKLLRILDEPAHHHLIDQLSRLDRAERKRILEHARSAGVLDQLGPGLRKALRQ